MQARLDKFASVYNTTIAGLNKKIAYADLRYPNGFAVRKPTEINSNHEVKSTNVKPSYMKASDVKAGDVKAADVKSSTINKQRQTVH